jgi:hypothetical protein
VAEILTLPKYLASFARTRWQFGELDCCTFASDWSLLHFGVDPMRDLRGTYSTERQYMKLVRRLGGFERCCVDRLVAAGFRETAAPVAGDLMMVRAAYAVRRGKVQQRPVAAICVSPTSRAVITPDRGVVIANEDRLPMMRAWTR